MTGRWFSLGTPVSFTNKTDSHDMQNCNWNIAESGVKHHKPNQTHWFFFFFLKIYFLKSVIEISNEFFVFFKNYYFGVLLNICISYSSYVHAYKLCRHLVVKKKI